MITRKQKKYINKHIKNTSISEIAKTIRISEPELENYLKNKFPGQKFESTLSRQHPLLKQKILNNINNFTLSRFIKSGFPIIFLLIFITVVIYSPSINGEFLSDDTTYIVKNPDLGSFDFITKRPTTFLRVLTDWTIYKIFGLNPLPYHIINLFFHITVSLCIYFIIYIIGNPVWAFLSSALVATHPIFIEGVSWITGGVYTMYGMFFFLSLLFYLLSYKFKGLYLISLLLFISSLITSEKAFVLGIAFLLLEWSLKSLKSNWRRAVPFIVSSMFSLLFIFVFTRYFAERLSVLTGMHDRGGAIYNPLVLVPTAISEYLKLIFWPSNLSLFHVLHTLSPQEYIARLIVFLVFITLLICSAFKNRILMFFLSLTFISLIPTFSPIIISWVAAERYFYIGAVGFMVFIGFLLDRILKKSALKRRLFIHLIIVLIFTALSIRSLIRNIDWSSSDALWKATVKTAPTDARTHNNMGNVYLANNDYKHAEEEFNTALKLRPNYGAAYFNLAVLFETKKQQSDAIKFLEKSIEIDPKFPNSYQFLSSKYFDGGKFDEAYRVLQKAIKSGHTDTFFYTNLGIVEYKLGKIQEAKSSLTKALNLDPKNNQAQAWLDIIVKEP